VNIAESESLSRSLTDIPHHVLNAKNDELEAAIIAQAGQRGAVTISTNMAGRGTDIELGDGVATLGGLYVIGTNKHESRRIDNQLRGRAGRQGDPGCSRFFVSREDDLMKKYGYLNPRYSKDPDSLQKLVEGQNLDLRIFLQKYEIAIEGQRHLLQTYRQKVLEGTQPCASELERMITLRTIDDLWADYLASVADFRSGVQWLSFGFRNPQHEYLKQVHQWFPELEAAIHREIERRMAEAESGAGKISRNEAPCGPMSLPTSHLGPGRRECCMVFAGSLRISTYGDEHLPCLRSTNNHCAMFRAACFAPLTEFNVFGAIANAC
jgi:preprotein translocase subunit SecA